MKKPSDLIIPFSFENRKPIIIDRLFFIPSYYADHDSWGKLDISSDLVFEKKLPVNIEYCSGNGQWILEKALLNPSINWIAVEYKFERARKIWVKMHNMRLKNLFIVFGEAYLFTSKYLYESCLKNIFINFPDPWPKKKQAKHRLVNIEFMKALSIVVEKGGIATIVTDDDMAKEWMLQAVILSEKWKPLFEYPYYINSLENYGDSYFKNLWLENGKEIKYLQFSNIK